MNRYTMEHYSALKKKIKEMLPFAKTRMNLEGIILSEIARESFQTYTYIKSPNALK